MITTLLAVLRHALIRLRATVTTPTAAAMLGASALASIAFWPSPDVGAAIGSGPAAYDRVTWVIALWLWTAVPVIAVAGRASGPNLDSGTSQRGLPALPLGLRSRAVAEVLTALAVLVSARLVASLILGVPDPSTAVRDTLRGALAMAPVALAWGLPSANLNVYMFRPAAVSLVVWALAESGLLAETPTLVVLSAILVVVVAQLGGAELRLPSRRTANEPAARRSRPARPPQRQLDRDTWLLPAARWGPWLGVATVVLGLVTLLDARGSLPPWTYLVTVETVLILGVLAILRPFDSILIKLGLVGRFGVRGGDFLRAFSVLPVRPDAVLRRVWIHAATGGMALCAALLGSVVMRSWLRHGLPALLDADGDSIAMLVAPMAVLVPVVAGFLVAAAAGARGRTIVSGLTLLVVVHGHVMLYSLLENLWGTESCLPEVVDISFLAAAVAVAAIPPLRLLSRSGVRSAATGGR